MTRKIIHIDMDAFYAAVEQRDNEKLRGKPVAVGGSTDRGVIMTASYEARKFGVGSAQPSRLALQKCPSLIIVPPRFEVYKGISRQIRQIFLAYTDLVEPLSFDEAYLDVTTNKKNIPSATIIARQIKDKIKSETSLTASAGVSINKFLAKIASELKKPDGLVLIPPDKVGSFIEKLPIEKFHGIGKATTKKMHQMGIYTGMDLKQFEEFELIKKFGKTGSFFYKIVRGIDDREVEPNRPRKSISVESTFENDLNKLEEIQQELSELSLELFNRMKKSNTYGKTLTVKAKYADFKQITRSKTLDKTINSQRELEEISYHLAAEFYAANNYPVRLLGIGISNFPQEGSSMSQLTLEF